MRQARTTSILGSAFGHSFPGVPKTAQIGAFLRVFGANRGPGPLHESPARPPIPAAPPESTPAPYKQEVTGLSPVPPIEEAPQEMRGFSGSATGPGIRSE